MRAAVLIRMGEEVGGVSPELARKLLTKAGEASDARELTRIENAIAKLVGGVAVKLKAAAPEPSKTTVKDLGDDRRPRQEQAQALHLSEGRLEARCRVTLDDAEAIMRALPKELSVLTRRAVGMVELLHGHLRAIGLEAVRPQLFKTTPNRLRIRVHDLRGPCVTVSLANGKSEAWVSDRTGHRSST